MPYAIDNHIITVVFPIKGEQGLAIVLQINENQAHDFLEVVHVLQLLKETSIGEVVLRTARECYFIDDCDERFFAYISDEQPVKCYPPDKLAFCNIHCSEMGVWITTYKNDSSIQLVSESCDLEDLYPEINKRMADKDWVF